LRKQNQTLKQQLKNVILTLQRLFGQNNVWNEQILTQGAL